MDQSYLEDLGFTGCCSQRCSPAQFLNSWDLSGGLKTRTIPLCLEAEGTFGVGSDAFEDAGCEVGVELVDRHGLLRGCKSRAELTLVGVRIFPSEALTAEEVLGPDDFGDVDGEIGAAGVVVASELGPLTFCGTRPAAVVCAISIHGRGESLRAAAGPSPKVTRSSVSGVLSTASTV